MMTSQVREPEIYVTKYATLNTPLKRVLKPLC